MHLLYIHQYFNFPEGSGGTRSYDLAKSFVEKGIKVTVVTSDSDLTNLCNSNEKWRIIERDGITVYVLNCPYNNKMGFYKRIWSFLSFVYGTSFKVLKIRADVVLATSTPLTIAIPALVKRCFQKTPFVFEVRDVSPEVPIKMGIVKNRLLIWMLYAFEKYVYKKASVIVPLSVGMCENITSRLKGMVEKLVVIPNISELERFSKWQYSVKFPFDLKEKKILLYCGTLGKVNGLLYLVDMASMTMQYDKNIVYCIVGNGKELDEVLDAAKKKGVLNQNFFYMGVVSKNELPYLYHMAAAGSSFVIDNPILWDNSANKFFDTLAAHRPIVINYEGWQAEAIREHQCGYILPPSLNQNDVEKFVAFINDPAGLAKAGENAYKLAEKRYSLQVAVKSYIEIFDKLSV